MRLVGVLAARMAKVALYTSGQEPAVRMDDLPFETPTNTSDTTPAHACVGSKR